MWRNHSLLSFIHAWLIFFKFKLYLYNILLQNTSLGDAVDPWELSLFGESLSCAYHVIRDTLNLTATILSESNQ